MKSVKKEDFSKETIYMVTCPYCAGSVVLTENPDYIESLVCEHCYECFDVED